MQIGDMNCPRCNEKMAPTSMAGIDARTCLYCKGVWLNNDSLFKLLHQDRKAPSTEELQASFKLQNTSDAARECPVCANVTMNLILLKNVEIDLCPRCGGLFFDEGELVKVLPNIGQENKEFNMGGYLVVEALMWLLSSVLGRVR